MTINKINYSAQQYRNPKVENSNERKKRKKKDDKEGKNKKKKDEKIESMFESLAENLSGDWAV